jgi:hypothetical protein
VRDALSEKAARCVVGPQSGNIVPDLPSVPVQLLVSVSGTEMVRWPWLKDQVINASQSKEGAGWRSYPS